MSLDGGKVTDSFLVDAPFEPVERCSSAGREKQTCVADFDGTLIRGRSSFPYFMLVALEGGGLIRSVILGLFAPLAWILYHFVSESAGIRLLIFISFAGMKAKQIESVSRAVLPKFYSEDVHSEAYRVFSSCGKRVVVTANPRIMVEHFAKTCLGADKVLGTEIEVTRSGYATGFLKRPGVLVGVNKRKAVRQEFGEHLPHVGIGDRATDFAFMALCKEAYVVPPSKVEALSRDKLVKPVVFHDGRLVQRPTPLTALVTFLWLPVSFVLAVFRIMVTVPCPREYVTIVYKLVGIRLIVKGPIPPPKKRGESGVLFVSSHRTLCDPVFVGVGARREVTALTYSISRVSEFLSPIKTVGLSRDRERDAAKIKALLQKGDLCICPEGTTCREPFLLRFSALFAELTDKIVPVALCTKGSTFHGTTVRGWKGLDPFFFFMNPFPTYEVTFLQQLPPELTVQQGGKSAIEVANHIQRVIADTLGFECTNFTRKDKYGMLAGNDGTVPERRRSGGGGGGAAKDLPEDEQAAQGQDQVNGCS
ncbi:hypothetical protein SELMODRAFT_170165 [Selaginella moellendorffii]|uniref:Uncharacterized protein GPAT1-1 n=1 Tax=Selaginella moellendorffii TaxID=88036 RepID=D8RCA3_SELML|nr:glycerol-3-phosphate 2-O-acyltransferase 6 [Selaginella moellendorffii]EFJ29817.1 hypothetical protein SELMODRAFT_170165 [Selaginella moellendorffii]|eukprot:XP_002968701.1 glycerol-3-phosphate 2-O-acyltransferase 6 [Selaginella moellendorffii]